MRAQVIRKVGKVWCIGPGIPVRIMTDAERKGLYDITDYHDDVAQQFYEQLHPGCKLRYTVEKGVLVNIVRVTEHGEEIPIQHQHFITDKNPLSQHFYYLEGYNARNKPDARQLRIDLLSYKAVGFKKRHK